MEDEIYNKSVAESLDKLNQAIPYYIDRIKELENELDYYKKAYINRVETQINDNHIPHID